MAMIYITCPDCTAHNPMPARAMLATLDLGEVLGPLGQLSLGLPVLRLPSAVGKQVDGDADDGLLGVRYRSVGAHQRTQREGRRQALAAELQPQPVGSRAAHAG
jgi:hypothetical protein